MGVQAEASRRGRSCKAQGPSRGKGLRPEARGGLRRGVRAGGRVGIRPPVVGDRGHHSWEIHHMDVKFAFLNEELKKIIYV